MRISLGDFMMVHTKKRRCVCRGVRASTYAEKNETEEMNRRMKLLSDELELKRELRGERSVKAQQEKQKVEADKLRKKGRTAAGCV